MQYFLRASNHYLGLGCVTGYQVIRIIRIFAKTYPFEWQLSITRKNRLSIRNNRFMFLHSEVLRYSSSASTIRPLFEYLFIPISGYEYFIIRVIYI